MKFKVLIIDDEQAAQDHVESLLRNHKDFQVVGKAGDVDTALAQIELHAPDVLFLDIDMPGKDGFAVCKELKENPHYHFFSNIPVLMLTVFPGGIEETNVPLWAGVTTEAEDYIRKPVIPEELLERAEELLKKYG